MRAFIDYLANTVRLSRGPHEDIDKLLERYGHPPRAYRGIQGRDVHRIWQAPVRPATY